MAEYRIDSIQRAAVVLRVLARSPNGVGVSELSREIGIGKASVFRIVRTLLEEGMVRYLPDTRSYGLGPELVVLGQAAVEANDLRSTARPVMERLSLHSGLPSYLNVRGAREVVCLEHVPSMGGINLYGAAGHTMPYHACPSGLILLASGSPDLVDRVLSADLERYGRGTITKPAKLLAQLRRVQADGYAVGVDDLEDGVSSLAAPVQDASGQVVASLGLAGFSHLVTHRLDSLIAAVRAAAEEISLRGSGRPARRGSAGTSLTTAAG